MTQVWIASGNVKKRAELERLLRPLGYQLRLQAELSPPVEVVEDAPTFAGNAALKARAVARAAGAPAIGDDSGLCVDALHGAPGIRSARWAGPNADDRARVDKLLAALHGMPPPLRTARFVCAIALALPDGRLLAAFEETCAGSIVERAKGAGGFGYDPAFIAAEHSHLPEPPTFAELSAAEKDAVSHRGKALRRLAAFLAAEPLPASP